MFTKIIPTLPPIYDDFFSCNLCITHAFEPVVTPCGHLYCWPCLFAHYKKKYARKHPDICTCHICECNFNIFEVISLYLTEHIDGTINNTKSSGRNFREQDEYAKKDAEYIDKSGLMGYRFIFGYKARKKDYVMPRPICFRECDARKRTEISKPEFLYTYGGIARFRENILGRRFKSVLSASLIIVIIILYGFKNKYMGI